MNLAKYSTSVRLPVDLEKRIREEAEKNMRSISNEIIFVLMNHYKKTTPHDGALHENP